MKEQVEGWFVVWLRHQGRDWDNVTWVALGPLTISALRPHGDLSYLGEGPLHRTWVVGRLFQTQSEATIGEKHGANKQLILTECKPADKQLIEFASSPTIS